MPSLVNNGMDFNDNNVLRDQPVRVNDVTGAIDIQNFFGEMDWLQASGDPLSYGPHLSLSPLANMTAKKVLFQFPYGDQTVPNPQESELIRSSGMLASTTLFRNDTASSLARQLFQSLPANPPAFLGNVSTTLSSVAAEAAQQQFAQYLTLDGAKIPDANAIINALIKQLSPFPLPVVTVFEAPTSYLETLDF